MRVAFKLLFQKHNFQTKNENKICDQYGWTEGNKFYGYSSYFIDEDISNKLLDILPEKYKNDFASVLIRVNMVELPPHIDNHIKTTINFYMDTAEGTTRFHKIKDGIVPDIKKLPNQTDGAIYRKEDLDVISSFKAEYGDIYVLDVKQIHSVKCKPNLVRTAYSLTTAKYSFDEVVNILTGK
jgi:hypothetical protein